MAKEKDEKQAVNGETEIIHTEELRDLIKEKEVERKTPWYKKLFGRKKNK